MIFKNFLSEKDQAKVASLLAKCLGYNSRVVVDPNKKTVAALFYTEDGTGYATYNPINNPAETYRLIEKFEDLIPQIKDLRDKGNIQKVWSTVHHQYFYPGINKYVGLEVCKQIIKYYNELRNQVNS